MAPQFADLNGDGKNDLLVGCFQGFIHYLPATENGFEKASWLKDSAGKEIHMGQYWGAKERQWVKVDQVEGVPNNNICVYPDLVDWDDDGDLDLVMGGRRGNIGLRINEGTATEPSFSEEQQFLKVGDKFIRLEGQVSVEVADVNGDDLKDLICATTKGKVSYFLNTGDRKKTSFSEETAIEKTAVEGYPCVSAADLNGDGKPDLLIGAKNGMWIFPQS